MVRIAVLDDYVGVAEEYGRWSELAPRADTTIYRDAIDPEDLVRELAPYEVVAITQERTRFSRAVLEALPSLRLIVCNGPATLVVDAEARRERGVLLCGAPRAASDVLPEHGLDRPAEMAWALLLAVVKRLGIEDRAIRAGGWQTGFPRRLAGSTLALAGLGALGGSMVPVARAFGMDVIAWSEHLTEERTSALGVRLVSKEELLREADVLGIFLRLGDRSRGLFGRAELALMKPTSCIVNISRGPIVDEEALVDALRAHRIAGAGLDVYDREPLPKDHPFRTLENVVLSPHSGYAGEDRFRQSFSVMAANVRAYLDGRPENVIP